MRRIFIFLSLLFALQAVGQEKDINFKQLRKQNPEFAASVFYSNGVKAKLMGRSADASFLFGEVLKLNPKHAASYYQLALLTADADSSKSLEMSAKAYEYAPENDDYVQQYVRSLIVVNKYEEAQKLLGEIRKTKPRNQQNCYMSIALAMQTGDNATLEEQANFYLENWGFSPRVVEFLAESMLTKRKYLEVEKMLTEYIETYPSDESLYILLAKVKASLFKDEEAVNLFKDAIALDSTNYSSYLALSEYYRNKKDIANYLSTLRHVFESRQLNSEIKATHFDNTFFDPLLLRDHYPIVKQIAESMYLSDPGNHHIEKTFIRFMMYTGDLDGAKGMIRTMIEADRADADAYGDIIGLENYRKNYDSSAYYANLATKKFPKDLNFPMMGAYAIWQTGDASKALEILQGAFKIASTDSLKCAVKTFEGDIYFKEGQSKKAFAAYDKALRYDSKNAGLLNNYAYYLSVDNIRLDDALKMSRKANELSPDNPTFLDTEAWVLYQLGRYEEARTVQRRALALDRDKSSELLLHFGDILYKLGDEFLAETYWKRALEAGAEKEIIEERLKQLK